MYTVRGVLFEFVTQSCLYVLKVQYYRALWLFGKSCKFTECREPEKRRTNFRLLKETNRKGTPLSVPRAKVVKHPKHFQRVCVLCAYVPLCVFAYFNVHSTEVKLCTLEVRRKWDRVHFARKVFFLYKSCKVMWIYGSRDPESQFQTEFFSWLQLGEFWWKT